MIGILLCVTALLQAQDSVKSFDEFFFVAGMDKIDGVFPVYVAEKKKSIWKYPKNISGGKLKSVDR